MSVTYHEYAHWMRDAFLKDGSWFADNLRSLTTTSDFDTLVGVGMSGALVVPRMAEVMGKKWAIVRKASDARSSHSSNELEGIMGDRWIFVDDLISSGATFRRALDIVQSYTKYSGTKPVFAGAYLYNDEQSDLQRFHKPDSPYLKRYMP